MHCTELCYRFFLEKCENSHQTDSNAPVPRDSYLYQWTLEHALQAVSQWSSGRTVWKHIRETLGSEPSETEKAMLRNTERDCSVMLWCLFIKPCQKY